MDEPGWRVGYLPCCLARDGHVVKSGEPTWQGSACGWLMAPTAVVCGLSGVRLPVQ